MLSLNISKPLPVSVAVLEKPEVAYSEQGSGMPDSYLSKSSHSHQKNDRARGVPQLVKVNSRHLSISRINENRVSVGKPLENSAVPASKQNQRLSSPPAVVASTSNKLYYVENTSDRNVLISPKDVPEIRDDKQSTQAGIWKPTIKVGLTGIKVESQLGRYTESPKLEHSNSDPERQTLKNDKNVALGGADVSGDGPHSTLDNKRVLEPDAYFPDLSVPQSEEESISLSQTAKKPNYTNDVIERNGSAWTEWGPCTVSCGTGTQERSRTCGPNCEQVESRECYLDSCHGIMSGVNFSDVNVQQEFHLSDPGLNESEMPKQTYLDTEVDACEMWSSCKDEYLQRYMSHLTELANCPCFYPYNLENNNNVWDDNRRRYYQWVEVNSTQEKQEVYRPDVYKCIRSLLFPGATTLAAQVCCYTHNLQLVTRGRNAGTPNLISPQISWELHYKIDILPWVICKGDWTRYNQVLSPNNMLGCAEFPDEEQLLNEVEEARDY